MILFLRAVYIEGTHSDQIRFQIFALCQKLSSKLGCSECLKYVFSLITVFVKRVFDRLDSLIVCIRIDYYQITVSSTAS